MKITSNRLRQLIREEIEFLSERVVSLDTFPKPDLPGYSKSNPSSGIIALNTKLNSLIAAVIAMNDTAASSLDLNNLRDKLSSNDIKYKKGTGDIETADDAPEGLQVASPDATSY